MKAIRLRVTLAVTFVLMLLAAGAAMAGAVAPGGQRRIDVGFGGFSFAPSTQTLNIGDQVTWVWVGGGHTVTNGTDPTLDPNAGTIFDSGFLSASPSAFTWKADRTGTVPFFCNPHFNSGMIGSLTISASGVQVSSFRITEVQYNEAAGHDRIEIANLGGDVGDLGRYRISINGTSAVTVPLNSVIVLSGGSPGRVVVNTNNGTTGSSATNLFMGGIGNLGTSGSVTLFGPNTKAGTLLTDATQVVDFVQWGAGNQPGAATAVAAGVWPSVGEFVPEVPVVGDYDLAFCGTVTQRGASFWDVAHPNFRSLALCATPTQPTTWGRIKLLYR